MRVVDNILNIEVIKRQITTMSIICTYINIHTHQMLGMMILLHDVWDHNNHDWFDCKYAFISTVSKVRLA